MPKPKNRETFAGNLIMQIIKLPTQKGFAKFWSRVEINSAQKLESDPETIWILVKFFERRDQ